MTESPWNDAAALWFLVRQIATRIDRAGEALAREELGISLAQYLVLSVVDAFPGAINQQAVANRLGLTKGTVSRQIDAAVAAGLMTVEVAAHSRREHAVALTPAGTALVRKGDGLFAEANGSVIPPMPAEDLAATVRTLAVLNESLGGNAVPEGPLR